MSEKNSKTENKSSDNDDTISESSYSDSQHSESDEPNFQCAQNPKSSNDYSSEATDSPCRSYKSPARSSQSPLRLSQSSLIQSSQILTTDIENPTEKGKVMFQLNEESQSGYSQSHCSQFYCSQTDEIAFCSQSIPGCYSQITHPTDSSKCNSLYEKSVLNQIRANDLKFTPTSDIFENQKSITPLDRENRIIWMIDNMIKLEVSVRALFLCVRLFNKVISLINMDEKSIILYSIACLGLGAKFENSFAQPVSAYAELSSQFSEQDIIECEQEILIKLDFQISIPTEKFFLNYWTNQIEGDENIGMTATFISFCSFLDSRICSYTAEVVAAAIFHITVDNVNPDYTIRPLYNVVNRVGDSKIKECENIISEAIQKVGSNTDCTIYKMFAIPERKNASEVQYIIPLDFNGIE